MAEKILIKGGKDYARPTRRLSVNVIMQMTDIIKDLQNGFKVGLFAHGKTPEEAFELAVKNSRGQFEGRSIVVLPSTVGISPYRLSQRILENDYSMQGPNAPIGCLQVLRTNEVLEEYTRHKRKLKKTMYIAVDLSGKEVTRGNNEKKVRSKALKYTKEQGKIVKITIQEEVIASMVEYMPKPYPDLNSYYFFGWTAEPIFN